MRFAASEWLFGAAFALLLAGLLILQGLKLSRDKRRFGDPELVDQLLTAKTSTRRAVRGALLTLAVALAAVAAAGPQYGRGTRVLPATNLDVVLVIDYSKSMYARDVTPARIERAKVEVARLISELGGARFGAVAFAGETMSFPLTSDGAAIAQFFRSLSPADMPVGGTGIARALVAGKELLARDPLSERHERVIVLVTDGEDLEGDPVAAAQDITSAGIRLEVVQIGGRTPEPIPDVDADGKDHGLRRDSQGRLLTTALSAEGEAQLNQMAELGGGQVVRAEKGQVGIDVITERLRKLMTEELSERIETVYADVYHLPLIGVMVLLLLETFLGSGKKRRLTPEPPAGKHPRRKLRRMQQAAVLLACVGLGCQPFDDLFERNSPVVDEAIQALADRDAQLATTLLTEYLETGPCEASVIGAGERARRLGDASLDLALALAGPFPQPASEETAGAAAGDPPGAPPKAPPAGSLPGAPTAPPGPPPSPTPPGSPPAGLPGGLPGALPGAPGQPEAPDPEKSSLIECALRVLSPVAENRDHSPALRARALLLMGNLELSRGNFDEAIVHYDRALPLTPGLGEGEGDENGRAVAHNRALALRLKAAKEAEEQQQNTNSDQEQQQNQDQQGNEDSEQDQSQDDPADQNQSESDPSQPDDSKPEEQKPSDPDGQPQGDQKPEDEPSKGDQKPGDEQKPDSGEPPSPPQSSGAEGEKKDAQPSPAAGQVAPHASASQDSRILDRLEQAPTLQQHDAQKRAGVIRMRPTMEDK